MSDTASTKDEMSTITPATSLAGTADSVSVSPDPSRGGLTVGSSAFKRDDALTADQLDSLYDDLPDDSSALKAIVGTMRLEMSKRDQTIAQLRDEIDEVKASHSVMLQRSAEWKDELESLRHKVPSLQAELKQEKEARELETDRVKDLRLRAEESRRAIMRLQGDQGAARAKAKADNHRSVGPGVLASWVPPGSSSGVRDEQEEAEMKRSKRASMIFGPNAGLSTNAAGGRPGHRRSASGSRSVLGNSRTGNGADDLDEPLSPTLQQAANGLRGLRLSGSSFGPGGTSLHPSAANGDDGNSNAGSRRSSYNNSISNNNGGLRSPRLSTFELPPAEAESGQAGRLSVPSGGSGIRGMLGLASPILVQTATSSSGFASPILEDSENADGQSRTSKTVSLAGDASATSRSAPDGLHLEANLKTKDVEVERLTREMREMKNKMDEAVEARLASEACLKALREFIATHDAAADAGEPHDPANELNGDSRASVGAGLLRGVKLPPLPTDDIDDDVAAVSGPSRRDSKMGMGGWSMKLPQLMRKNGTGSSYPTPAPTPSEEAALAVAQTEASQKNNGSSAAAGGAAAANGPATSSSIGGSIANLLSRNSMSAGLSSFASTPATGAPTSGSAPDAQSAEADRPSPVSELVSSPSVGANGFKGFGWFKKGGAQQPGTSPGSVPAEQESASAATSPSTEFEDKVMSPPFRSLDHDQVAIRRQSVALSPDSALARTGEEGAADSTKPKRPAEPELSVRAQKALEKTANVEGGHDFVPAAFD